MFPSRACALGLVVLLGCAAEPPPEPVDVPEQGLAVDTEPEPDGWEPPDFDPATWADELAVLDGTIGLATGKADANAADWLALDTAASTLMSRARLTGSYDDYARAEELLTRAFEAAPEGSGPISTRAALNFTLHRLDRVPADLDHLEARPPQIRPPPYALANRRGALALQLGDYATARPLLTEAVDGKASLGNLSGLALYFSQTGDYRTAESLTRRAFEAYHGRRAEPVAWLHLQLGLMDLDRGRYDAAAAHYADAAAVMPGWYLVDEHVAEIHRLQGRTEEAVAVYERVIESTENPEFMDAMAGIERDRQNEETVSAWIERARVAYEGQIERFPEAAYGHALGHFLEFGDPARAVELAEANHTVRPNGEAKVLLADAYLAAGRAADAKVIVEEALASPYRKAELHVTASAVYAALGDAGRAEEQRLAALAINPRALD